MTALRFGSALLAFALIAPWAHAHRLNLTESDINWDATERAIFVTHRLHLDDALALLHRLGAGNGELDLRTSAKLMNYLEQHFTLASRTGPLTLEPWGAHIQDDVLFIYQRWGGDAPPSALEVRNTLLHDVQDGVSNQVNWRVADAVRSHTGDARTPVGWLVLEQ